MKKPRRKRGDIIAGGWLLFLIVFLSGRIFSAGWDEFYATTEFIGITAKQKFSEQDMSVPKPSGLAPGGAFAPGASIVGEPQPLAQEDGSLSVRCLPYLQRAYPDINFARSWDPDVEDWLVSVTIPADGRGPKVRTAGFYWAGGLFLPAEELENRDDYSPVLYDYPKKLADPVDMTEEEKEAIKAFSSTENRKEGAGESMFLFDFIYQSDTRGHLESHLTKISFLRHKANVHERMVAPLRRVEKRIFALAKVDGEVATFLAGLKSNDSYLWRRIAGTKRKSFHSLGIALDVLPKSQGGKHIFWSWAKERHPDDWMLIPLKNRWMPPASVIEAFEAEGFIWGGKWVIWDNMHFEYHPELIEFNFNR